MQNKRICLGLCGVILLGSAFSCYAWNALGHRLVGQIAYDQLTSAVKERVDHYNQLLDTTYHHESFVNAAPWMDSLRYVNDVWMKSLHYIDTPFSVDGTPLVEPEEKNAVSAISNAFNVLTDKKSSDFDKGFSVRVLLHVVGDLHQPLHAADQYSREHPTGDRGGNLFYLGHNPIAGNLHAYWDKGGGFLESNGPVGDEQLQSLAQKIEAKWPCDERMASASSKAWSEESFQVAVEVAYSIKPSEKPSQSYQEQVQTVTEQRLALAGCRLAKLLNQAFH